MTPQFLIGMVHFFVACCTARNTDFMTVQQIFLNNSTFDDSTTMYFATTYVHDSSSNVIVYGTVNIHDTRGIVTNSGPEKLWMRNDTIFHQRSLGAPLPGYTVMFEGIFLRL